MLIRKISTDILIIPGNVSEITQHIVSALEKADFKDILVKQAQHKILAKHQKNAVWGKITIKLFPKNDNQCMVHIHACANIDWIIGLFAHPNKIIVNKVRKCILR
jgi:hypothetical protein